MSIYLQEADKIYFKNTKEYFQEVMSSYSIGNYRSANVMLYSVAICDILLKLQELQDMYNDSVAKEILEAVKKQQKQNEKNPAWENKLLEMVKTKTQLLDAVAYTHLKEASHWIRRFRATIMTRWKPCELQSVRKCPEGSHNLGCPL